MGEIQTFLQHPAVKATISGALAAAAVDIHAFLTWKSADDARTFDWGTAAFRWAQGAIAGLLGYLGVTGVVG